MWNEVLEDLVVVKRSGQRVDFNASKIAIAIKKAFDAVYEDVDERKIFKVFESVLSHINNNYKDRKTINVEDIQDIIENSLRKEHYEDVYYAFNEYRQKRAASRKVFSEKQQHKFVKAIELVQNNENENNRSLTPNEVLAKFGDTIAKEYAKSYILDTKYVRALEEGNIFIHNLNYFSLGYVSHVNLKIDSPKDEDYLDNTIVEILNASLEVNNEIGINEIDMLLKEYILYNYKLTFKKYLSKYFKLQGVLEFIGIKKFEDIINKSQDLTDDITDLENLCSNKTIKNILYTAYDDTKEDLSDLLTKTVNKLYDTLKANNNSKIKYTLSLSTSNLEICKKIRNIVNSYLADNNYISNIHTIFKITSATNDDYLSKIASLMINGKNISIAFIDTTYNSDEKLSAEYFMDGIRLFELDGEKQSTGRAMIAATSVNLARLGLKYRTKKREQFYEELGEISDLAKNELLLTFETIGNKNKANYKTLFNGNILGDERLEAGQKIRKIIKSGTLNLGLIGLKECVCALESETENRKKLALDIIDYFEKKCIKYSEETKLNFCLFEPTDEHSRKYLMAIDKSIYDVNKGINDRDIYSLSYTIDENDYQFISKLQKHFKGGTIFKIKFPSNTSNKKITELIKKISKEDIGFVNITVGKS